MVRGRRNDIHFAAPDAFAGDGDFTLRNSPVLVGWNMLSHAVIDSAGNGMSAGALRESI